MKKSMPKNQFAQLSDESLWEGACLATTNARVLFESATIIATNNNPGCSVSLLILSAEESIKAITTGCSIVNREYLNYLPNIYRSHEDKHKQAITIASIMDKLAKDANLSKEGITFGKVAKYWLKKANTYKNLGFYVDFKDNKWQNPQEEIKQNEREVILKFSEIFLSVAEMLFKDKTIDSLKSLS